MSYKFVSFYDFIQCVLCTLEVIGVKMTDVKHLTIY
jgi:hypothetical protein